jgi:ferrous iron transport protein B
MGSGPIVLVGNPNVGKSAVFRLTGRYVEVSNYPGTTVEVARGTMTVTDDRALIIDTPGTNSLSPRSDDERVTRDILLAETPRAVLQVADAKNLRRALLLSTQLAELGVPMALDLNMADEADLRGVKINPGALSHKLGVPVTTSVATRRDGLDGLVDAICSARPSTYTVLFDDNIECAAREIAAVLQSHPASDFPPFGCPTSERALALMLLSGDAALESRLNGAAEKVASIRKELATRYADPLSFVIMRQRLAAVDTLMSGVYHAPGLSGRRASWTEWLGTVAVHPVWGVPVLLIVLALMYLAVGKSGRHPVDWMHTVAFGQYINSLATHGQCLIPYAGARVIRRRAWPGDRSYGIAIVPIKRSLSGSAC